MSFAHGMTRVIEIPPMSIIEKWTLGDVVRKLREQKGWGQKELFDASNVPIVTISRLEQSSVESKPGTLQKLAGALGYRVSEIYAELESLNGKETQTRKPSTGSSKPGGRFPDTGTHGSKPAKGPGHR
jgi:ribosome-binding protein aMBF1 (putative translation factor)